MTRISVAVAAAVLAAAWGAAPALAVDEGVPDLDAHPAVGLLGVDLDGPGGPEPYVGWNSGFVVSDRVFVTAAHPLEGLPPEARFAVTLQSGSPAFPVVKPGRLVEDFPFPFLVAPVPAREAVIHPRFSGAQTREHDVAVILFAPGTFAGVNSLELPRAGMLSRLEMRGRWVQLVGYGGDPEWGGGEDAVVMVEGYRQAATAPFQLLTATRLQLDGRSRRTGGGGLCVGDSGSPQLLGGTKLVLSLLSNADSCSDGPIIGQRLDTPAERKFLSEYVRLEGKTARRGR